MSDSTFDRMTRQLPKPADTGQGRKKALRVLGAAAAAAALVGIVAATGADRLLALFTPAPAPTEVAADAPAFHPLPDVTVNLRPTARVKLLKLGLTLKAPAGRLKELEAAQPMIVDMLQEYLRQLDEHDLEGPAQLEALRAQLLRRIRLAAGTAPVDDVLLRTLIIQ